MILSLDGKTHSKKDIKKNLKLIDTEKVRKANYPEIDL